MRFLLAGLGLCLIAGSAHAQCACTCVAGRAVAACASAGLVQPICQQICPERIEQSLTSRGGGIGGGGGIGSAGGFAGAAGLGAGALGAGALGAGGAAGAGDKAALRALMGR